VNLRKNNSFYQLRTGESRFRIITASMPAKALPKTNASSSFLAMLITDKFVDGLQLTCLPVIHLDETTVQVLKGIHNERCRFQCCV
jgi:hypothetical protein